MSHKAAPCQKYRPFMCNSTVRAPAACICGLPALLVANSPTCATQAATATPGASQQAAAVAPSASQQSAEACDTVISSLKKQRQKYARAKAPFGNVTWAQRGKQLVAAVRVLLALCILTRCNVRCCTCPVEPGMTFSKRLSASQLEELACCM